MKVSDELVEKLLDRYWDYPGNQKESLAAALAVLPETYTVEQVEAAMHNFLRARFAMPDKYDRQSNIDDFIARLTQQTPAAPDVQNDVKPSYVATPSPYVSSFTTSEMKYPDVSEPCPKCGCADTPSQIELKDVAQLVRTCLFCKKAFESTAKLKEHFATCELHPLFIKLAEKEAEHKAKMRELFEELMPMSDGLAYKEKLYRKYGLTEPTPAERVTVRASGSAFVVERDGYLVKSFSMDEREHANIYCLGMIAQLKKETA